MKKICILINHFQISDGVARTAVGLANELSKNEDFEITIRPLFKFDKKMLSWLRNGVKIKPFFRLYFRGFAKLVDLIPDSILYKLLIGGKYDVEIGFCMELPIKIVAAGKNNAKRFSWIHGYDTGVTLYDYYKKTDKVISVSKQGAERFTADTNGEIPVDYCYNLVDDEKIRTMGEEDIPVQKKDGVTFAAVGRLEPGKGIKRLIECAGRLKKEGYNLNIWLIGDGEQREELEKTAIECSVFENVLFLGTKANPYAYTAKADVLVCASYSEGYSTVCTEAIMLGTPVLTTSVNGAKEIIEDAECGMMVGMDDNDLYEGMKSILDNPGVIKEWKNTLTKTKDAFSYKTRAERLWKVLGEKI